MPWQKISGPLHEQARTNTNTMHHVELSRVVTTFAMGMLMEEQVEVGKSRASINILDEASDA